MYYIAFCSIVYDSFKGLNPQTNHCLTELLDTGDHNFDQVNERHGELGASSPEAVGRDAGMRRPPADGSGECPKAT